MPALLVGPFSDPDGDSAAAIGFRVAADSGFTKLVCDSGFPVP